MNGDLLQKDHFPNINPNIFISHSHADEDTAIAIAVWLKKYLDVNSFIDSLIWENEQELRNKLNRCGRSNDVGVYMMLANAVHHPQKSMCLVYKLC
ncbi:hypothetical protein SDC9_189616 [bioreactor metagenome]|uniref:TIR domain-containing protein n=1 Tax=bioreactor metagenome TaxID=1076179 RepID=A0A645HT80_9ZZZZ